MTQSTTAFRRTVLRYFDAHQRDLPWRHTRNPYCVLVSEIMLQQTQVDRVVDKYTEFITRFPTVQSLAAAPLAEVLKTWQGLGYNRRALFLHRAAQVLVRDFGGVLPQEPEVLRSLPGIGPATARSIAVYAFNRPEVFIETNIRAVIIHHFFGDRADVRDEEILPIVEKTLDRKNPWQWYSALMDYGATLKKQHTNPARRSAHHVRQSTFEGSDRQIRGAILRALVKGEAMKMPALVKAAGGEAGRVRGIVESMVVEGLVCVRRGVVSVAGDMTPPRRPHEVHAHRTPHVTAAGSAPSSVFSSQPTPKEQFAMPISDNFGFYAILTDPILGYERLTGILVEQGVSYVQLRMKERSRRDVVVTAKALRHITDHTDTKLIINDDAEVAKVVGADGVHLGQSDMSYDAVRNLVGPGMIVGLSTHNPEQTRAACALGPDYIGVGPVFATPTKKMPDPVIGIDGMKRMLAVATVPAIAIGGIDLTNLASVLAGGARNFCMVRQINQARDPAKVLAEMRRIVAEATAGA